MPTIKNQETFAMKSETRIRMETNRGGITRKIRVGKVELYVTLNVDSSGTPREMFVKSTEGWQGWGDTLALTASLAMQHGCPLETIMWKWRGMKFEPHGIVGQGTSIPDAIARVLLEEDEAKEES